MGASSSVISSSILLPVFILGVQLGHHMVVTKYPSFVYKMFIGSVIIVMASLSWGLTRDLALNTSNDRNRFAYSIIGWFVVLFVTVVLLNNAPVSDGLDDITQFQSVSTT